jgi:hypothetical protein
MMETQVLRERKNQPSDLKMAFSMRGSGWAI